MKHVCKETVHWYQFKAQDKSCSSLEESLALVLHFNMKENFHLDSATVCTSPPGLSKNWSRNGVERLFPFSLSCHFSISKHMTSVYSHLRLSHVFQKLTWWSWQLLGKWVFIKTTKLQQTQHHDRNYHSFREGFQKISLFVFTVFLFVHITSININVTLKFFCGKNESLQNIPKLSKKRGSVLRPILSYRLGERN